MRRPTDWDEALDLPGDPTPGDPTVVEHLAEQFSDLADDCLVAATRVHQMGGDAALLSWIGWSGDAFRNRHRELYDDLRAAWAQHAVVGDALKTYAVRMRDPQADANRALLDGRDAKARLHAARDQLDACSSRVSRLSDLPSPPTFPVIGGSMRLGTVAPFDTNAGLAAARADLAAAQSRVDEAENDLAHARRRALAAGEELQDAARRCARDILSAQDADIGSMIASRWGLVTSLAADAWDAFLHARVSAGDVAAAELRSLLDGLKSASPEARARAVAAWFAALDEEQRQSLLDADPELIGNLDGVPPELRYAANIRRIEAELAKVRVHIDAFHRGETGVGDGVLDVVWAPRRWGDRDYIAELQAREKMLASFLDPAAVIDPRTGTPTELPRQFLLFDPAGDGRVAEVLGDLGSADHVAVMVPGITNELTNYGNMLKDARVLSNELGSSSAVVTWLGYDTPELGNSTRTLDRAIAGQEQLRGFVAGLEPFTDGSTTVLAHSYGSVVTGLALRNGLRPDNVVVFGSPGMTVNSVAELGLAPGTGMYALRAPGDYVSYSENFGNDPADPDFGATRLATGPGVEAHSKYYAPETVSLENIASVVRGNTEALSTTDTPLWDEGKWAEFERKGVETVNSLTSEDDKRDVTDRAAAGYEVYRHLDHDLEDAAAAVRDAREAVADGAQAVGAAVVDGALAVAADVADGVQAAMDGAQAAGTAAIDAADAAGAAAMDAAQAAEEAAEEAARAVADAAGDAWHGLTTWTR